MSTPVAPSEPFTRAPSAIRHGRLARRSAVQPVIKGVVWFVCVVLVSVAGVAGYTFATTVSAIHSGVKLREAGTTSGPVPQIGASTGAFNLLIVGTDTRTGQGGQFANSADQASSSGAGNNDVTMVLHVSNDHRSAQIISIPRDLVTTIPACINEDGDTLPPYTGMFNTTLARGGLGCVASAATVLTGLRIPYAVEFTFDGVIAMSDAVGGVTVCIASPINDPYVGLNLAAGEQTLVGWQALAFVRSRHGVGNGGDLGRISNQQLFLSAVLRKVSSAGTLSNPFTLYSLAQAATQSLTLSDTLSNPATLVSLALTLKDIPLSNIVFLQYPAVTDPADPNRVVPDIRSSAILKQSLINDVPVQLSGTTGAATEVDPKASASAAAPPTAAASGTATAAPTPTASPGTPAVTLPPNVTGQTAAQRTCTLANQSN